MIGHVHDLDADQQRELLGLLTQEPADLQTDDEVLAELADTLRRQLGLSAATDLAEGFRRRMIRIAEELREEDVDPGYYDFRSDRKIAEEILMLVDQQATDGAFLMDFAKTFQTMSQDKRATWLRTAALAAGAAEPGEADRQRAADAATQKSSAEKTALRVAADVAGIVDGAPPKTWAALATAAAARPRTVTAAAPLGLVAGGAVAFAIRRRRKAAEQARAKAADVQVRRERQATQAVVTTCAYILSAVDPT